MFAKFTALLAVATAVVASPAPAAIPVGALPTDIAAALSSAIEAAAPTGVAVQGGLPLLPTDASAIKSALNQLSSVLAELPVPTGIAHITPVDTGKLKVNAAAAAAPSGTNNGPTAELLKPTEDLDIGSIISGLPIVGPILGPILGGLLGGLL
ncbi:hypothetical protein C8Q78DRAFT_1052853 [Trametes maxima]|nr:hypothetical protein C8Q78DRAFT_1052853 [Trametes maxima]